MQTFTGYDEATQVMDRDDIASAAHSAPLAAPGAAPGGNPPTTPPSGEGKGWRWASLVLILAILGLLVALVVIGRRSGSVATGAPASVVATNPTTTVEGEDAGDVIGDAIPGESTTTIGATIPTTVIVTVPATTAPKPTVPSTTTPPTTTPPTTTPPTTTPTATIGSFTAPTTVDCSNPMQQTPYINLSWTTAYTTKVSVSIDGPGVYKNYGGGNGSDSVPFACGGPHSYTLTATDGTHTVTKTVNITKA